MKHSEILQLALDKYLAQSWHDLDRKARLICLALDKAVDELPYQASATNDEIVEHIMECLHPAATVLDWLTINNYIGQAPTEFELDQVQQYRKRWVLHLIEEYKKQGK